MKTVSKILIFLLSMMFVITSCKKDKSTATNFHFEYAGFQPGSYVIYDVLEIFHDAEQSIGHDTSRYQLKTLIGDTIIDNEGRIARRFLRYVRDSETDPWILKDIWTAIIDDYKFEVVEENQRVIKLVFAPTITKEWNANAYNMMPELISYYENIHDPYSYDSFEFDSTLTVEQENELNLIEYRRKFEVYAKNIGLVRKYYKDLKINDFDSLSINYGNELFLNYLSSGVE